MTDPIEIDVIYIGRRQSNKGPSYALITQAELDKCRAYHDSREGLKLEQMLTEHIDRRASLFSIKASGAPFSIGSVYTIQGNLDDDGRITTIRGGTIFKRSTEANADLIVAWTAADRAVHQAKVAASLEKSAVNDHEMAVAIDVLRARYKKISGANKMGFKLWLMDELARTK